MSTEKFVYVYTDTTGSNGQKEIKRAIKEKKSKGKSLIRRLADAFKGLGKQLSKVDLTLSSVNFNLFEPPSPGRRSAWTFEPPVFDFNILGPPSGRRRRRKKR